MAFSERIIQELKDMDSDTNDVLEVAEGLKCHVAFKQTDLEHYEDISQRGKGNDISDGNGDGGVISAKALYSYEGNEEDTSELEFDKGEILEIIDNKGKWWKARKKNGMVGIVPCNYMQFL
ncbi:Transmembrane osmosensor [Gryganskiella cystojenkinii]|nr:Transmembrane osmosensor [Gryganskiella cystojenkinii]